MLMRKFLSLGLGFLSAATSLASVKTITIPAVPKGANCEFVVKDIPSNLGLSATADSIVRERLINTTVADKYKPSNPVQITLSNEDGAVDTINCVISTGKRGTLLVNDTTLCASDSVEALSLIKLEKGSYWWINPLSGDYEEKEPYYDNLSAQTLKIFPNDTIIYFKPDTLIFEEIDSLSTPVIFWNFKGAQADTSAKLEVSRTPIIFTSPEQSSHYLFLAQDTITGCWQTAVSKITVKNCALPKIIWENYNGLKHYNAWYGDEDYLKFLDNDSIKARDPRVKCICPLPLDTIIETNRTRESSECGYYNFDVTVKLAATIYDEFDESKPISDTIVAYVVHVMYPIEEITNVDQLVANYAGNCTFTVPDLLLEDNADCNCTTYFNFSGMTPNPGDTLTETTNAYMTFRGVCGEEIVLGTTIIVPDKDEVVSVSGYCDTTVLARDKTDLMNIVSIRGTLPKYNWSEGDIQNVPIQTFIVNAYKDTISDSTLVLSDGKPYYLDDVTKSGSYIFVVEDRITGCEASTIVPVIVKDTNSAATLLPADMCNVRADIYTISGVLVMKDTYLKDAIDRLNEGLYIFNNKKLYIKK